MTVSPLRAVLDEAIAEHGCTLKDLTVLATQNDPFRIDTDACHRDGRWLAMQVEQMGLGDRKIHLRGLHYRLMSTAPAKPNGEIYRNTDPDWRWLQEKAADAARWLGYISFDRIADQRNDQPTVRLWTPTTPRPYLHVGIDVEIPDADDLEPYVGVADFEGAQPYKIVMIGEKHSLNEVLGPVAARYGADLYLPTGEPSDTMLYNMARIGADDGRPMVVLYFADCDPAGWQMPISAGRKLQAFRTLHFQDLKFEVHRVALTPEQVREYGLPSTPMKATEKRADRWLQAMGIEQTEIDSLAALQPGLLRRLAEDAVAPFYDRTLDARVSEARQRWQEEAQEIIDAAVGAAHLDEIRTQADTRLAELRDEIAALNDALRIDTFGIPLPEPVVPEPQLNGRMHGTPLLDSRWPYIRQTEALKASKAYLNGGAS